MERANNCCEFCKVPNYKLILRGTWNDTECYQDDDGTIYDANTSEVIGSDYVGEVHQTNKLIKVVLTIISVTKGCYRVAAYTVNVCRNAGYGMSYLRTVF
jgi:hypothetical protein